MTIALQTSVCAFDVDAANLACLEEALPGWEIRVFNGMTAASLRRRWDLDGASLLIVAIRGDGRESLELCRVLAPGRPLVAQGLRKGLADSTPAKKAMLFVLLPPEQEDLVWAMQDAGADRCLFLPLDANEVTDILYAVRSRDPDAQFLRDRQKAQREDRWRDDGGPG
jgi:hypothetical protein